MGPTSNSQNASSGGGDFKDRRRRSYQAAGRIARQRMRADDPALDDALSQVGTEDIVVVEGVYDHVERVLGGLDLRYTPVPVAALSRIALRPEQLLIINCPGNLDPEQIQVVRTFVEAGGSLFTTDWGLQNVLEPAFPGTVAFNKRATKDDVVRLDSPNTDNPFLAGVMDGQDDPQWWLEGSSYPISVLDPDRVEVLLSSAEMGERYGDPAIAVMFKHGLGEVFHMVSHYYLQRTDLRSARHRAEAASYLDEKGVMSPDLARDVDGLTLGEVESAATSARLFANVVADKRRRVNTEPTAPRRAGPLDVFVYGTLMPGHRRFALIESYVESTHRAEVKGSLYDSGLGYPAMAPGGDGVVHGWVIRIAPQHNDRALAEFDVIESSQFQRIEVETVRGRPVVSYRWRGSVDGLVHIAGGRWRSL